MPSPPVEWLLSDFYKERDDSMLPIFKKSIRVFFFEDNLTPEEISRITEWNCLNKQLLATTKNIRDVEQTIQFLEKWCLRIGPLTSQILDVAVGVCAVLGNDVRIQDVQRVLHEREVYVRKTFFELARAMDVLLRHELKGIESPIRDTTQPNPFDAPLTLIRIWNDDSHTLYTESVGFRCGNWKQCQPVNDFIELGNSEKLLKIISDHCEGETSPSDWISFSDNASWILSKFSDSFRSTQGNCRVAVINVASLDRLRIPWQRSDSLVKQFGGTPRSSEEGGVQYAWPGHYLVYGWVPSQCIIKSFTLEEFETLCKHRNIPKGNSLIQYSLLDGKLTNTRKDSTIWQFYPPHKLL